MKYTLVPDYRFDTFDEVTVDFLNSLGIKGILLDIDNTLEPYENSKPSDRVLMWLNSLHAAGICTAIVSNNNRERVECFNKNLKMPAYFKAGKPFSKNLKKAMADIGTSKIDTVFIGDQILTDVWAAHNAGLPAILVAPINDKKDIFTKFKRILEKPFIIKYETLHRKGIK